MHKGPVHTEKLNDLDQQWEQASGLDDIGTFFLKAKIDLMPFIDWSTIGSTFFVKIIVKSKVR